MKINKIPVPLFYKIDTIKKVKKLKNEKVYCRIIRCR